MIGNSPVFRNVLFDIMKYYWNLITNNRWKRERTNEISRICCYRNSITSLPLAKIQIEIRTLFLERYKEKEKRERKLIAVYSFVLRSQQSRWWTHLRVIIQGSIHMKSCELWVRRKKHKICQTVLNTRAREEI